jgi:adenylate cyclase class 2
MSTEIEAKLKVDSLRQVESRLGEIGAEFLAEQLQRDYYFDDASSSMKNSDRALRLRRETSSNAEKTLLTYKGPRAEDNFKKRQEIEVEVGDVILAEKLFLILGYQRTLAFEKKRRIWQVGDCNVSLDQLPLLGGFVEIEGPDDKKIADIQKKLGLANLPHIPESYALLIEQKLHQLDRKEREVLL